MMNRALFCAALSLALAATVSTGCELLTGIHEREAVEATVTDGGVEAGACSLGTGDCDGMPENGCEAILSADSKHCGACNHDCRGDACSGSVCAVVLMTDGETTPETMAVSDKGIYWTTSKGVVRKIPLAGGNVQSIGVEPPAGTIAFAIALGDENVYWTLFNKEPPNVRPGVVMRADLNGDDVKELFLDQKFPAGITADSTSVYWSGGFDDRIYRGSSNGGAPEELAKVPTGAVPLDVTVDEEHVYWAAYQQGSIYRALKVAGNTQVLADDQQNPFAIAINEKGLYWTNLNENAYTKSSVWMLPKEAPLGTTPILVAEKQYAATAITADDKAVYWAVGGQDVGVHDVQKGSILTLPLDAEGKPVAGASPTLIADKLTSPTAIKSHNGILYWITGVKGGQLFRMVQ